MPARTRSAPRPGSTTSTLPGRWPWPSSGTSPCSPARQRAARPLPGVGGALAQFLPKLTPRYQRGADESSFGLDALAEAALDRWFGHRRRRASQLPRGPRRPAAPAFGSSTLTQPLLRGVGSQRDLLRPDEQPAGPTGRAGARLRAAPAAARRGRGRGLLPGREAARAAWRRAQSLKRSESPARRLRGAAQGRPGEQARRVPRRAAGLPDPRRPMVRPSRPRWRPRSSPSALLLGLAPRGARGARGRRSSPRRSAMRRSPSRSWWRAPSSPATRAEGGAGPGGRRAAEPRPWPGRTCCPSSTVNLGFARSRARARPSATPASRAIRASTSSSPPPIPWSAPRTGRTRGRGRARPRRRERTCGQRELEVEAEVRAAVRDLEPHPQERRAAAEGGGVRGAAAPPGHAALPARPGLATSTWWTPRGAWSRRAAPWSACSPTTRWRGLELLRATGTLDVDREFPP